VADRIAQTVVPLYLEPVVEPLFHPDSYGYRPGRSALQAVGICRGRCWRRDWVIDLDIRAFLEPSSQCPRVAGERCEEIRGGCRHFDS
jgi:RNA-directed DNA polymerase